MKRLYVCGWESNGTNELLIVEDSEVVGCIPEALFGVRVDPAICLNADLELARCYEDFIGPYSSDSEDVVCYPMCREISLEDALKRVAVSPTQSADEIEAAIKGALNE